MQTFWENIREEFNAPFTNSVLIFSVILFIILLAPLILRKLKIPGIIGLILSGLIIGPHGLNLIEKNSAVDLFSTIGLLYIMFIAGLELELEEFRKNRHKSLVFGVFTFILPLSIGLPVCMYVLGYGFYTSLLTASMFSTHTLVAYPIVSRLGITKNEAVAITVGGTIFTDTAVLILLPVITGSAGGHPTHQLWIRLLTSFLIFLAIVIIFIPRVSRWFFKSLEGEKYSHFIYVLSVVFFCAFLAELAGLEPIIGAFAAGLALNKLIPQTSPLMNRIEFAGNALFIPFFLISVGMIVDVGVLTKGPTALIVAATLTGFALATKWLAAWATALWFKYSRAQRTLIFGLSSSHAAATLAIILVGFKLGIIDENILNGTIVLILVTCLVASFATEQAGKVVALGESESPTSPAELEEESLLVPIANPETMSKLIDFAILLKKPKSPEPIYGLSVVEDGREAQAKLNEAKKMLEKAIHHAAGADQKIEVLSTIDQNVASGIIRVAKEVAATDVIMGFSTRKNISDLLFGKTIQNIIDNTTQQIIVCQLVMPLNVHTGIRVLCPPFAEREFGFGSWVERLLRLSSVLGQKITLYGTEQTFQSARDYARQYKLGGTTEFRPFEDWDDFLVLSREFQPNDMIVLVSPREGSISYVPELDTIPHKLDKYFSNNSFILIHPKILDEESLVNTADILI